MATILLLKTWHIIFWCANQDAAPLVQTVFMICEIFRTRSQLGKLAICFLVQCLFVKHLLEKSETCVIGKHQCQNVFCCNECSMEWLQEFYRFECLHRCVCKSRCTAAVCESLQLTRSKRLLGLGRLDRLGRVDSAERTLHTRCCPRRRRRRRNIVFCTVQTHLVWSAHVLPRHTSRTAFAVMPNSAATHAAVLDDLGPSFAR